MELWAQIVLNALTGICWVCLAWSYFKGLDSIYYGLLIMHFRVFVGYYVSDGVLDKLDPASEVFLTILLFFCIVVVQSLIGHLFTQYHNHLSITCMVFLIIGLNRRIYTFSDIPNDIGQMCINSFPFIIGIPFYMYCIQSLNNL